jgi:hypothetical protein
MSSVWLGSVSIKQRLNNPRTQLGGCNKRSAKAGVTWLIVYCCFGGLRVLAKPKHVLETRRAE